MNQRMHPQDLRAIVAAIVHGPIQEGTSVVVEAADHLLGTLAITAKPESRAPMPGEVDREMLVNHVDALTVRAEKAEAGWEAASKTILDLEKRNGEIWSANVDLSRKMRDLEERIAAAKGLLEPEP